MIIKSKYFSLLIPLLLKNGLFSHKMHLDYSFSSQFLPLNPDIPPFCLSLEKKQTSTNKTTEYITRQNKTHHAEVGTGDSTEGKEPQRRHTTQTHCSHTQESQENTKLKATLCLQGPWCTPVGSVLVAAVCVSSYLLNSFRRPCSPSVPPPLELLHYFCLLFLSPP